MEVNFNKKMAGAFGNAMEREPILKNRVIPRKTTGVGRNFLTSK
jgi:hypothetical protein